MNYVPTKTSGNIKMVMTRGKDDEKALYHQLGNKDERKKYDTQFKNAESNFKIAILMAMCLIRFRHQSSPWLRLTRGYGGNKALIGLNCDKFQWSIVRALSGVMFGAAELPLMRVKAARGYVPGEIAERIREVLG